MMLSVAVFDGSKHPRSRLGRFVSKPAPDMPAPGDAGRAVDRNRRQGARELRSLMRKADRQWGIGHERRLWRKGRRVTPADEARGIAYRASLARFAGRLDHALLVDPDVEDPYRPQESAAQVVVRFQEDGAEMPQDEDSRNTRAAIRRAAAGVVLGYTPQPGRVDRYAIGDAMDSIRFLPPPLLTAWAPRTDLRGEKDQALGMQGYVNYARVNAERQWDDAVRSADAVVREIAALHADPCDASHDGVNIRWTGPDGAETTIPHPISGHYHAEIGPDGAVDDPHASVALAKADYLTQAEEEARRRFEDAQTKEPQTQQSPGA